MPALLLAAVASLIAAAAGEAPSEEVVSLVQTRFEGELKPLMKQKAKVDLESESSIKSLVDHFRTLEHDIAISLEVSGPKVVTQVTKTDLSKCQELTSQLDVHLAELKSGGSKGSKSRSRSPKLNAAVLQQFQSSVEKRLYGPENQVVHMVDSRHKALCMEGPTHYMKNVLVRLRSSPLKYGYDKSNLDYGECRKNGFPKHMDTNSSKTTNSKATPPCFPQSSTWLHRMDRHDYTSFNTEVMELWVKKQGKTMQEAAQKMKGLCLRQ